MSLYKNVIEAVRRAGGGYVATCYIAHVLAYHGKTRRIATNRIDPAKRVKPCPANKWQYIEDALRELGVL